jgi:L-seryl-tRNA(Ser) seleniumtransferase
VTDPRGRIPSVDSLVASEAFVPLVARYTRARVVIATRAVVDEVRSALVAGGDDMDPTAPGRYAEGVEARLAAAETASLRSVINATGVVLHTNLGRAPLAAGAVEAMRAAASEYTNLEYDLDEGARGSRYVHCVELLTELTGAEDALVVNNAAGALVLAMSALAYGRAVLVSRGELIEIGGGFRIPEILGRAGATLVEIGTTNRTRLADYEAALDDHGPAVILKVHRSNFRISGFTEEATVADLAGLADARGVALVHDLGSGLFADHAALGLPDEPTPARSLADGAGVVVVSGDKLLGGPQAGIVVGRSALVQAMRASPLCRALRVDKVTLAGLEATLRLYRDPRRALHEIPTLRMLSTPAEALRAAADRLAARLGGDGVACRVREHDGAVGGGTYPETSLASWAIALEGGADALARALREGDPPVVGRIVDDTLLLDVRTVLPGQEEALARRVVEAVGAAGAL